jgi:hypothetical protein
VLLWKTSIAGEGRLRGCCLLFETGMDHGSTCAFSVRWLPFIYVSQLNG